MKKIVTVLFAGILLAANVYAQKGEVFSAEGKAIKGYDPVAFFTESKAVMGADSLMYQWNDANWYFSSSENMEKFKAKPEAYAPQFGGYCAYGVAEGHKAPTETDTWTIVNGKLYFNYNKDVKKMWVKKEDELIKKADKTGKN